MGTGNTLTIEQGIENGLTSWEGLSLSEMIETAIAFERGGLVRHFARFLYRDREKWNKLVTSHPYDALHGALHSFDDYTPFIERLAESLVRDEIQVIHSMGSNASFDKVLLEKLIEKGQPTLYLSEEISAESGLNEAASIKRHLDGKFGNAWKKNVDVVAGVPTLFELVSSSQKSCVIYTGGTIMNSPGGFEQAARIAGKGGIVVCDFAYLQGTDEQNAEYWNRFYDTPELKGFIASGLRPLLPGLFTPENKEKWGILVEYVKSPHVWAEGDNGITPRVSMQLQVLEPVETLLGGRKLEMRPTINFAEAAELEEKHGGRSNAMAIAGKMGKSYPIELIFSSRLNPAQVYVHSREAGLEMFLRLNSKIPYESMSLQGRTSIVALRSSLDAQ